MNKKFKVILFLFSGFFTFLLLSIIIVVGIVHRELEKDYKQDLSVFQTIQMVMNLNFDSENELQLKEERNKEQYEHISIYYPDDFTELLPITKETLDSARSLNQEFFGQIDEVPIDFMIVQDGNELQQLANLESISGFYSDFDKLIGIAYDNKEAILAEKETPLYIFQKSILHEYTHYVFARLVQNTSKGISLYPTWFHEGICEYIANNEITVDYSGFQLAPLTELQTSSQWQNARFQQNHEVYFQSYFVIKYLVDTYGSNILKEIIDETNTEEDFETGFLKATGITINNFEQDFLDIAI